jgi:NADP-reducing hydrogenase subunit HndC
MAPYVKESSLCGLGQTAPNPVLTTIRYFRGEYEAHIYKDKCPAGACKSLVSYCIDPELCIGCGLCAKKCPQQCISGEKKKPHAINAEQCIRCGVCREVCKVDAVKSV